MPDREFPVSLVASRTVTGEEWRLQLGNDLTFVPEVGVFTEGTNTRPEKVLPKVLRKAMAESD